MFTASSNIMAALGFNLALLSLNFEFVPLNMLYTLLYGRNSSYILDFTSINRRPLLYQPNGYNEVKSRAHPHHGAYSLLNI